MRIVVRCLGVILLAGLLAACESHEPPVEAMDPPAHAVELPADHDLGNWLERHPDLTHPDAHSVSFVVVAGQYRHEGGVRFSCPVEDADCKVTVMYGCHDFIVVSTGGRVSAENHIVNLPDDAWRLWYCARDGLSVPAGEYRDVGDVRFSCPSEGADCEVTFTSSYCIPFVCREDALDYDAVVGGICVDRIPGAVSIGGAVTAELVPNGACP